MPKTFKKSVMKHPALNPKNGGLVANEEAVLPIRNVGVSVEDSWQRAQRMWGIYARQRNHHALESWDDLNKDEQTAWHVLAVNVMDELYGHLPEGVPLEMRLVCPDCCALHIDVGEFATKVHHTHACQDCGMVWRPAVHPTVGVAFLPGFKNS